MFRACTCPSSSLAHSLLRAYAHLCTSHVPKSWKGMLEHHVDRHRTFFSIFFGKATHSCSCHAASICMGWGCLASAIHLYLSHRTVKSILGQRVPGQGQAATCSIAALQRCFYKHLVQAWGAAVDALCIRPPRQVLGALVFCTSCTPPILHTVFSSVML